MANRSARALVVELVADVQEFVKGTQKADTALGDFVGDAERDLDRVERATKDMADDAERHFDNLARSAKTSFNKIGRAGADEMTGGGVKESFGEAGSEVGAEFAQNLGESLSSGDLSGVAKDTAGGLVSAFAGIAGPIGVGLAGVATVATTIFAKMQAEAEAKAKRIADQTGAIFDRLTADMTEALGAMTKGAEWDAFVSGFSKDGDAAEGLREMTKTADQMGVSVADISAAFFAGGAPAEAMRQRLAAIEKAGTKTSQQVRGTATSLSDSAKAAKLLRDRFGETDTAARNAAESSHAMFLSLVGANAELAQAERNYRGVAREAGRAADAAAAAGQSLGGRSRL